MVPNLLRNLRFTIIVSRKMSNYRYYNRNPANNHINDCVCRAISNCTGLSYGAVDRLLATTAKDNECEKLCVCCYDKLLKRLGYKKRYCNNDETVADISMKYKNYRVIIRIKAHLTSSIYGKIEDTWDCSDYFVDCFWLVQ